MFELFALFWVGLWILFCVLVSKAAASKGRDPAAWGVLAFFISPLLAAIFLMAFGSVQRLPSSAMPTPGDSPLRQKEIELQMELARVKEAEIELEREKLRHSG